MLARTPSSQHVWPSTHLLESFVVDEAGCILGYVELTLLNVLAKLPTMKNQCLATRFFSTNMPRRTC
jgi:hypothetical protein